MMFPRRYLIHKNEEDFEWFITNQIIDKKKRNRES
jgi:hypothetical protein